MAHYAQIDDNNIVLQVLVADEIYPDGKTGSQWLVENIGGRWIQTSYNTYHNAHKLNGTPLRGNFAGKGMTYDEDLDVFLYPKPFPSWVLNSNTFHWEAPVAEPTENPQDYQWDEEQLNWIAK